MVAVSWRHFANKSPCCSRKKCSRSYPANLAQICQASHKTRHSKQRTNHSTNSIMYIYTWVTSNKRLENGYKRRQWQRRGAHIQQGTRPRQDEYPISDARRASIKVGKEDRGRWMDVAEQVDEQDGGMRYKQRGCAVNVRGCICKGAGDHNQDAGRERAPPRAH